MEKIKEDLTQPRFEVKRNIPFQSFMKMIKFPGSNVMHFDPDDELIKKYKEEIDYIEAEVYPKDPQLADKLGGLWQKDLCGICYRSKVNAVFMPCRHCEVCSRCAVRSTKFNGLCPFCRNKIEKVICYKRSMKVSKLVYDEYDVRFRLLVRNPRNQVDSQR